MPDEPQISVVIAAYNEEDTIGQTIQTLLGQTITNYEIIVVDDGSTDKTAKIVNNFSDERVKLYSIDQNRGLPAALNRGIQTARGKYIARADADERSLPCRLQRQVSVLESSPEAQVVSSNFGIIGPCGGRIVDIEVDIDKSSTLNQMLRDPPKIAHGSVMVRSETLEIMGGYREEFTLAQDYDLWLRIAEKYDQRWLSVIPEVLYERRIDGDQIAKRRRQIEFAEVAKESARRRKRNEPERLDELIAPVGKQPDRELTDSQRQAMYHYLAGTWLLHEDLRRKAALRQIRAIVHNPTEIRPWYRLSLTAIPKSASEPLSRILNKVYTSLINSSVSK